MSPEDWLPKIYSKTRNCAYLGDVFSASFPRQEVPKQIRATFFELPKKIGLSLSKSPSAASVQSLGHSQNMAKCCAVFTILHLQSIQITVSEEEEGAERSIEGGESTEMKRGTDGDEVI